MKKLYTWIPSLSLVIILLAAIVLLDGFKTIDSKADRRSSFKYTKYHKEKAGNVSINAKLVTNGIDTNKQALFNHTATLQTIDFSEALDTLFSGVSIAKKSEESATKNKCIPTTYYGSNNEVLRLDYNEANTDLGDSNSPLQILYSKHGIEYLQMAKLFTFQKGKEVIVLSSFDKIANSLYHKYNSLLTQATYYVSRAELFYIPVKADNSKYKLVPAWILTVNENSSKGDFQFYDIFNAITAEEIIRI